MCISAGTMMMIAAATTAAGALSQGMAQQDAYNDRAREDLIQKAEVDVAAVEEAKRIRRAGDRQAGAARAALAASGVDVNQGTALNINEDIIQRTENDAHQTLLTGKWKSDALSRSADRNYKTAEDKFNAGVLSAGASGFQGFSGWKKAGKIA